MSSVGCLLIAVLNVVFESLRGRIFTVFLFSWRFLLQKTQRRTYCVDCMESSLYLFIYFLQTLKIQCIHCATSLSGRWNWCQNPANVIRACRSDSHLTSVSLISLFVLTCVAKTLKTNRTGELHIESPWRREGRTTSSYSVYRETLVSSIAGVTFQDLTW